MLSEETKINNNSLIAGIWKWQIIIFWILTLYVFLGPVGSPQNTLWYVSASLSIALVVVCVLLVLFGLFVVVIKRHNLGVVKAFLAVLVLVLCNVPGSMALYFYLKSNRFIGKS
ncbi:hypothetical protein [Shewanella ulleungensis]|jgi:hypothetical protein|uniref:hypothetical protein n=1 Tax=Shewanella ulleungensis TaxID=2282699 RepID=UPI003D7ACF3E